MSEPERWSHAALRGALLEWYQREGRALPWRQTRDPYAVWLSEVMLQQTTVATVLSYWPRFLSALPTIEALAEAPLGRVLALWSGLGYYRRARYLHAAARRLMEGFDGRFPGDLDQIRSLPGVGPYTAAAVGSIAFGLPNPVVDGNVVRVLTRLDGKRGRPDRQPLRGALVRRAEELLHPARPGDSNQALMELGATVCKPRDPSCNLCPWRQPCGARRDGLTALLPETAPRPETVTVWRAAAWVVRRDGRILLRRAPEGAHNAGLWELPWVEFARGGPGDSPALPRVPASEMLEDALHSLGLELGLAREDMRLLGEIKHNITRHRIRVFLLSGLKAAAAGGARDTGPEVGWFDDVQAGERGLTGAARKLLALATVP